MLIKPNQKLGKYRVERRLGEGGFATVFRAMDTIEGVRVALKVPHDRYVTPEVLADFRHEVRVTAKLDHPNILPIKNAEFINGHFVIAFPLGERTLSDRLHKRISLPTALHYSEQMLDAVAHAHERRVIHCDIKPENFVVFPDNRLRLTDFGIAKVAMHTLRASGSGTIGFVAPEQAMGRPSFRSDVFSLGLIMIRLFSGHLPEWPFTWPPAGYRKMRGRLHAEMIDLMRRATEVDPRKRFRDAVQMRDEFYRAKRRTLRYWAAKKQ